MIPAYLLRALLIRQNTNSNTLAPILIIVSIINDEAKGIVVISPEIPTINNILKMLLPTILPIAISALPFLAAVTDVNNSGRDVPKATTVSPMNLSLAPKNLAISVAELTVI